LSTTVYISSLEVASITFMYIPRTMFLYKYCSQGLVYIALFMARRSTLALHFRLAM
ncbi:hypothetical protein COCMIDRAFT_100384, partial [Bipolaris oryzae ATCC 44560]